MKIANKDEAAEFLNSNGDWVLVSKHDDLVSDYGTEEVGTLIEEGNYFLYYDATTTPPECLAERTLVELDMSIFGQAIKGTTGAETVAARQSLYGPFSVHAKAEQDIKRAVTSQPGWEALNDVQKSAMEMIVHKMARILNNTPDYDDNWHDIAGYATCAENDIKERNSTY